MSRLEAWVAKAASKAGLTISRTSSLANRLPIEATDADRATINFVRPFTMTSSERIWALLKAVDYVVDQPIEGDFVECGVWRGGSVMAMTRRLMERNTTERKIWLYDTFQGMTEPTEADVDAVTGTSARTLLDSTAIADGNNVWCVAGIDDVRANVLSTGYPKASLNFVKGDVAETLAHQIPDKISLLRLDTDWYASTKTCLETLYPLLEPGGVCILDDYGHWQGARQAVEEYFNGQLPQPLMMPIDFSGRIMTKP